MPNYQIVGAAKPCSICGSRNVANSEDVRAEFVRCPTHVGVPGMWVDVAQRQFKKKGATEWDEKKP